MCLLTLTLAGFSLALGDCAAPRVVSGCPPLVTYSGQTQARAAQEIRAGKSPTLNRFVIDYGKTRRACRGEKS